jgi:hypothetical protein
METYQIPHALGATLAMFLICSLYLPSASAGELRGTEWKVTHSDSLYTIGHAVYPGDARKQAQLRRDIMRLNPSVFGDGVNRISVGIVLKLPDYVVHQQAAVQTKKQAQPKPASPAIKSTSVAVAATGLMRKEWVTKSGDTLYAIGRSVYPGDAHKQARLREDIIKLNPSVVGNGANNIAVGVVLKLPDYVVPKYAPSKVAEPAQVPAPVPVTVIPKPVLQPVAPAPVIEPQSETPTAKEQPVSSPSRAEGGVVLSLGFSYGGDKLAGVDGGPDISAGTGVQLRLGYEQMFQHGSGYRISLGLQYYTLFQQNDASFRSPYLQLAYQYQANPIVYGIGVVYDAGATLESDITTEYDAAIGAVVYLENVGSGKLAGWGLSYTFLDIEEKNSGTSVDASRAELYYRWRF